LSDTTELLRPSGDEAAPGPAEPTTGDPGAVTPGSSPTGAAEHGATGAAAPAPARRRRSAGSGLAAMVLPELQALASSLGVTGVARMRKNQLIAAISAAQGGNGAGQEVGPGVASAAEPLPMDAGPPAAPAAEQRPERRRRRVTAPARGADAGPAPAAPDLPAADAGVVTPEAVVGTDAPPAEVVEPASPTAPVAEPAAAASGGPEGAPGSQSRPDAGEARTERERDRSRERDRPQQERPQQDRPQQDRPREQRPDRDGRQQSEQGSRDDEFGGRRRGRFRDRGRNRQRGGQGVGEPEPVLREDDVLLPVAGILDVLDNYAFVRTAGYLTSPNDVYVSLNMVRRYGLRRGDAVTGAVRQQSEGDPQQRRDKYNALVRLDTVNGLDPEAARRRPEFTKLTPLYPQERLRLESEPHLLTTRIIDLVMPIGKGQRALIVSPPKAGKTMVLQAIANAITHNNPECHLMVVLVDERPEEVTDMQRSVKGEVIASTFDRPPSDHTSVAELSIERAKRLVEMGHDVVVLLDSITRLGRAYNLAAPASGRILSGGVDSTALYPPKRFLGAARNIEHGGSLTILATALVETGSTMDTVIFEEFKGTGNAELKLDRRLSDKRIFPAVDIDASGTRKEEILLAPDELSIVIKLRRVLHALDAGQALELLLDRLKQTRTNYEFLMQIAKTTPGND
jgi:transcription termination factor Rho